MDLQIVCGRLRGRIMLSSRAPLSPKTTLSPHQSLLTKPALRKVKMNFSDPPPVTAINSPLLPPESETIQQAMGILLDSIRNQNGLESLE